MRVNILSYEPAGGWILYDYAAKLAEHLRAHVEHVTLGFSQAPGFDVTFHVNYAGLRQVLVPGLHSTMVTHIDTADKFKLVEAQAAAGVWAYCMSEETARRLNTLTGHARFLNFAPPAMMAAERKRLTVMITGRLYEDGRKNEAWAIEFFKTFRREDVVVRVMGSGWEARLADLQTLGYAVEYSSQFDRVLYVEWLRSSDHLLITGNDEGALSTLDAMLFDVVPIVTAQGYHLEQEGEIITYATRDQLMAIASRLQRKLDEANGIRQRMTNWDGFAKQHALQWSEILARQQQAPAPKSAAAQALGDASSLNQQALAA